MVESEQTPEFNAGDRDVSIALVGVQGNILEDMAENIGLRLGRREPPGVCGRQLSAIGHVEKRVPHSRWRRRLHGA